MLEVRETEVFVRYMEKLRDSEARSRIAARIRRLAMRNPGDVKAVGENISELRIDYGRVTECISSRWETF